MIAFSSPRYAVTCILTVNERLLSANCGRPLVIAAIPRTQFAYAKSVDMQALQRQRTDAKGVAAATPKTNPSKSMRANPSQEDDNDRLQSAYAR